VSSDYWESDMVFVTMGKRYGVTESGRTICIGPVTANKASQDSEQPLEKTSGNTLDSHQQKSVTKCQVCGASIIGKRPDKKTCSPKCRKVASRGGRQMELVEVN
jgi:hypothetical protein